MKCTISNVKELTTKTGNPYKMCSVATEQNNYEAVSVWSDSPLYDKVVDGAVIEAYIDTKVTSTKTYYNLVTESGEEGNDGVVITRQDVGKKPYNGKYSKPTWLMPRPSKTKEIERIVNERKADIKEHTEQKNTNIEIAQRIRQWEVCVSIAGQMVAGHRLYEDVDTFSIESTIQSLAKRIYDENFTTQIYEDIKNS